MKFLFFSGSATNYLEFNIYGFVCCPVAVNKNHNNNINNNYYYNKLVTALLAWVGGWVGGLKQN